MIIALLILILIAIVYPGLFRDLFELAWLLITAPFTLFKRFIDWLFVL